jgi:hypothetical protein
LYLVVATTVEAVGASRRIACRNETWKSLRALGSNYRFWKTGMPKVHELSDEELRKKLARGELSGKKALTAHAVLRRRRRERIQEWLKRHSWLAAILAAIGLAGIFAVSQRDASE